MSSPPDPASSDSSDAPLSEWPWLWREVRPFAHYQIASLLCTLAASALGLAGPLVMKWLIDDVLPNRRWRALGIAAGLFFGFYVGRMVISSIGGLINMLGVQRLVFRIRTRLLARLQALPAAFYATHPTGDLVQRLEQDVTLVGQMGSDVLPSVVRMTVDILMTVAVMVFLDWRVSAVVLPLLPLFGYVRHHFRATLRRAAEEVRAATGQQSSLLNELLTGAVQIQLLGAERRMGRRYALLNLRTMKRQMAQRRTELLFTLCSMSAIGLGTAAIIGYGGVRVITGTMTAGALVAFYSYVGNIFSPMSTAVELYARLNRVRASIRRLMDIERAPNAIADRPDAVPLAAAPEVVVCTHVGFGYRPGQPALHGIDFDARAGERVAVVGESGCGKSSLLKLIPRLYDVDEGRIEIDGRDVRALGLRSLRQAVSFVPQDPTLFHGTLRENLKHGCPTATPHQIAQAAWIACLTDVVGRLPHGWDSPLGPMGVGLSGGEKQRVAIARALLQGRPILILDEATSALDAPTEHRLLSRLQRYCERRIVIIVSHRLSAARWASRVVVLHEGRVVEDGTHQSLYQPGTRYYALWQRADAQRPKDPLLPTAAPGAAHTEDEADERQRPVTPPPMDLAEDNASTNGPDRRDDGPGL